MGWQKCPICNGTGSVITGSECKCCEGKMIISELTGLPPTSDKKTEIKKGDLQGLFIAKK